MTDRTKPPKLVWIDSPLDKNIEVAHCGMLSFTASRHGFSIVEIYSPVRGGFVMLEQRKSKLAADAKRKCQAWFDRQWRAMERLKVT